MMVQQTTARAYLEQVRNKLGMENNYLLLVVLRETFEMGAAECARCCLVYG